MKARRKRYAAEFKARVAIEAIKGQRTVNEIGALYEVHPNQVSQWKKQALEQLEVYPIFRPREGKNKVEGCP